MMLTTCSHCRTPNQDVGIHLDLWATLSWIRLLVECARQLEYWDTVPITLYEPQQQPDCISQSVWRSKKLWHKLDIGALKLSEATQQQEQVSDILSNGHPTKRPCNALAELDYAVSVPAAAQFNPPPVSLGYSSTSATLVFNYTSCASVTINYAKEDTIIRLLLYCEYAFSE